MKKLMKNETEKMIAGVCAGMADYFGMDVSIIRLVWVIFTLLGGSGVLAYIILAIVLPGYTVQYEASSSNDSANYTSNL